MNFRTPGYEHLELSTQILIAEALERGVQVEVLDAAAQFVRLTKGKKTEYVQEATKTSLDSYVTSLILGNKWVTKRILEEAGVPVPHGFLFTSEGDARAAYARFSAGRWVVKPKTTNFGIGITLLGESASKGEYEKAVREAFHEDTTIVVEEFIEGEEHRFLVIQGRVVAVMHRVPANVVGDGTHTIRELVEIKNQDPRRGKGHVTPLERLELRRVEHEELARQGLSVDVVPGRGERVFLRRNSNISTGGDSLDRTDDVDRATKKRAIRAAGAAGATLCGVDMILGPQGPVVLELNFNPVLYCHDFPYVGKNRHTGRAVLDALGF